MIKDQAFLADAAKRKAIINPATGEEVEAINREIFLADAGLIKAAQAAISTKGAGSIKKKRKNKKRRLGITATHNAPQSFPALMRLSPVTIIIGPSCCHARPLRIGALAALSG